MDPAHKLPMTDGLSVGTWYRMPCHRREKVGACFGCRWRGRRLSLEESRGLGKYQGKKARLVRDEYPVSLTQDGLNLRKASSKQACRIEFSAVSGAFLG